jgi:hypothetical protein
MKENAMGRAYNTNEGDEMSDYLYHINCWYVKPKGRDHT